MKRLTILGIIACVVLLIVPAAVISAPAGPPGGLEVQIVNPLPVPVTGDIEATVTGDVNVTNTPDVNVVNEAASPIPVTIINEPTTGEPITIFLWYDFDQQDSYVVPSNKRLVITHISSSIQTNDLVDTVAAVIFVTNGTDPDTPIAYLAPFTGPLGTTSEREWLYSERVQLYIDGPNEIRAGHLSRSGSNVAWYDHESYIIHGLLLPK